MTLDLAKLRAETLALIDGTTPGPWAISRYTKTHISAVSRPVCSAGGYSDNSRPQDDVLAENVANARLIAAAPTLAADTLRLLDEIERLRGVLERIETASQHWADYEAAPDAVHYAHESTARLARAALSRENRHDD